MIQSIKAKKILNSKGESTVEVEVETKNGAFRASVPSGGSVGLYEAKEISAKQAIKNIKEIIAPKLKGMEIKSQKQVDDILIGLDGAQDKSKLGANAILAVSIACCRALAKAKDLPLYQHINVISQTNRFFPIGKNLLVLPRPCFNILEGGAHAGNKLDIQEFMIVPKMESFKENLSVGIEVYNTLGEILKKKFGSKIEIGQEGGFAPSVGNAKKALDFIIQAIEKAGRKGQVEIGLDAAASEFSYKTEELLKLYEDLIKEYPILFLEDPFSQDDWNGFQKCVKFLRSQKFDTKTQRYRIRRSSDFVTEKTNEVFVVGDDLTATNMKRMAMAKEKNACNAIILKPNQIGSVSEAIEAGKLAKSFGWKIIVSHRSGETMDDFIADLAVGINADFIKSGAPAPKERMEKYSRLLEIENNQ